MNHTRRDLGVLIPALFAAAGDNLLPSKTYEFSSLEVKSNPATHNESRQVFDGTTHEGVSIDLHITTLAPGQMPHPAHHHEWEEMIFVQTGTLEVNIKGDVTRIGPWIGRLCGIERTARLEERGRCSIAIFCFRHRAAGA